MKILVTGASGLVGTALIPHLSAEGHQAIGLPRRPDAELTRAAGWNPVTGKVDAASLDGADAVVHLAGENIGNKRWTAAQKKEIRDSRVEGSRRLCMALAESKHRPRVFVAASAIGYYGDRGDTVLTEESAPGQGFLPDTCREWEAAAGPLAESGTRVVHLRSGIVLSPSGGPLAKMLTPFRLGIGGVIGDGRQYMSWIALEDSVAIIHHVLVHDQLRGAFNATAPQPVTNRTFTTTLGKVLGRPTVAPLPAFAARLAFGEMADALLLSSARVMPARLQAAGYRFRWPELEPALRRLLE